MSIHHFDLDIRNECLPLPGAVYDKMRANLAGVGGDGLGFLREVQPGASYQMRDGRKITIAYP